MRLWSYQLLPYLPRLQLVSQWRECVSIITKIKQDGTPNHILVNRVLDYPLDHFYTYRVWTCGCGATINRDENAAINIMNEGLRMLFS